MYDHKIPGAYAAFFRGGGPNFLDFGYICREAACREPLLGGFGSMLPQEN